MSFLRSVSVGCLFLLFGTYSFAQSDPGVSIHNYKHPNKARKAKQENSEGVSVRTMDYLTAKRLETIRGKAKGSTMPKYARRYPALSVRTEPVDRSYEINPLNSPQNYKTQKVRNGADAIASIE